MQFCLLIVYYDSADLGPIYAHSDRKKHR